MIDQYELERRLRSAELIWLYRFPGSYITAMFITLLAILFLFPLTKFFFLVITDHWNIINRTYSLKSIPILFFIAVFLSFFAILMWRLIFLAHVTLTSAYFEYTNFWGRRKQINLSDIKAATIYTYYSKKGSGRHVLKVQQLMPGPESSMRWIDVTNGFFGVRCEIAESILQEINRRCALIPTEQHVPPDFHL